MVVYAEDMPEEEEADSEKDKAESSARRKSQLIDVIISAQERLGT